MLNSKYSTADCLKIAKENKGKFLSPMFLGYSAKHRWKCKVPEHDAFEVYFANMIRRGDWCKKCRHREASLKAFGISLEEWKKRGRKNGLNVLKFMPSRNRKTILLVQCLNDPKHKQEMFGNAIQQGFGCRYCNRNERLSLKDAHKIAQSKGGECLSTEYINAVTPMKWQCGEKPTPWNAPYAQIRGAGKDKGSWCPECSKGYGERVCRTFFEQLFKQKFPSTNNLPWLKRKNSHKPLQLDGYSESLKLAFEHHGRYHYDLRGYYSKTKADIQKRQKTDELKRQLCKENGITLIEILEINSDQPIETLKEAIRKKCLAANYPLPRDFNSIKVDLKLGSKGTEWLEKFRMEAELRGFTLISDLFVGTQSSYLVKCSVGHPPWGIKYGNLRQGRGCPHCRKSKRVESRA